jgi:hypothetical protein
MRAFKSIEKRKRKLNESVSASSSLDFVFLIRKIKIKTPFDSIQFNTSIPFHFLNIFLLL